MGVDTELYIDSKWEVKDVIASLKGRLNIDGDVKINPLSESSKIGYTSGLYINFMLKGGEYGRSMFVYPKAEHPLSDGVCTVLSLRAGEEAVRIMRAIGEALGGLLMEADCDGKLERIYPLTSTSNGIPYYLQNALIEGAMEDEYDVRGLLKYIAKRTSKGWLKKDIEAMLKGV